MGLATIVNMVVFVCVPAWGTSRRSTRLGTLVDRCCFGNKHVPLPPLRGHVRTRYATVHDDGRLAASHCQHHRRCCVRWYRRCSTPESTTRSVDTNHQLCALGHGHSTGNVGISYVFPSTDDPQTTAEGGNCVGLSASWSTRSGWICDPAAGKSGKRCFS